MLGVSVMLPLMLVEPAVVDGALAADVDGAEAGGGPTVTWSRRDEHATTRMVAPTAATIRRCTRSPYGPQPPLPMAARLLRSVQALERARAFCRSTISPRCAVAMPAARLRTSARRACWAAYSAMWMPPW